ncbi:MAG TPA: hypothetical protein VIV55_11550 [Flavobacterium sp.]
MTPIVTENLADKEGYVIVSYHVEEKIGSNVTTYDVGNLSLVEKNDLGPNNTRVVTPKYGAAKPKPKVVEANRELPKVSFDVVINTEKSIQVDEVVAPVKKLEFIMVDIMSTYERILDREYESIELLKKVANNRYFQGELTMAYKWYSKLFALTTDLEIVYYYRYAQALKSVGQVNKSNEMMKVFENKKVLK